MTVSTFLAIVAFFMFLTILLAGTIFLYMYRKEKRREKKQKEALARSNKIAGFQGDFTMME